MSLSNLEIEHKFLVPAGFDLDRLNSLAQAEMPRSTRRHSGVDTYFWAPRAPSVFRHRVVSSDGEIDRAELTLKGRGGGDTESRLELDLELDVRGGDSQLGRARSFAGAAIALLPVPKDLRETAIRKKVTVWMFHDCEVCYYEAALAGVAHGKTVRCVEFEALDTSNAEVALATIFRYEAALGFAGSERCRDSLLDIFVGGAEQKPRDV